MKIQNMGNKHFLFELKEHYPRLKEVEFTYSDKDEFKPEQAPAGTVESIYFYERKDFENAVIALAYKLEKKPVPASMGAVFLDGLPDYAEMTKKKLIILSRGGYSGLKGSDVGFDEDEWFEKSLCIRKYHELAHFNQRILFPENTDALRNEIVADMTGLLAAFGRYDSKLAKAFLGIEGDTYKKGGRLENYLPDNMEISEFAAKAESMIHSLEKLTEGETDAFTCQIKLENIFAGENIEINK